MTADELVEPVADAIEREVLITEMARVAVAVVMAEAMNVADSVRRSEVALQCAVGPTVDREAFNHHRAAQMAASDIAAALRALIPGQK